MPPKVDSCVDRLLKSKTFKPKATAEERKSSAFAICNASLNKKNAELVKMFSNLPEWVDISLSEDGDFILEDIGGEDLSFDETSADATYDVFFSEEEDSRDFHVFAETMPGEDDTVNLELLREGAFAHWIYGDISFDKKYFLSVMQNYANDILDREISFDANHKPVEGAVAWLKELGIKRRKFRNGKIRHVLTGNVELTDWGRELIEGKRFKYFSIEVRDNYTDKETEEEYGPTCMGGGITNRPFIPGMRAIEMSEDAQPEPGAGSGKPATESVTTEELDNKKEEAKPLSETNEDIKPDTSDEFAAEKRPTQSQLPEKAASPKKGVPDMNFEEKIQDLQGQYNSLEDKTSGEAKMLSEQIDAFKSAQDALEKKVEEAQANTTKMFEDKLAEQDALIKKLNEQDEERAAELAAIAKQKQISDVQVFCDKLAADKHYPALVKTVREMLLSDVDAPHTMTLSEDGKEVKVDMTEVMRRITDSIPAEGRVDESVNLHDSADDKPETGETAPGTVTLSDGTNSNIMSDEAIAKAAARAGVAVKQ